MSEIKDLSADPEWVDNFQEIYARLKSLSSKCTNMDFIGNSTRKASTVSGGFENKCVLCVILTKILENYISIHKKDVTDFIEK